MGVPDIPTDDLVFLTSPFLDRSYPGTGTSVTNIATSFFGQVGTMTGGITFASGLFACDGVDPLLEFADHADYRDIFAGVGTALCWSQPDTIPAGNARMIATGAPTTTTGWSMWFESGPTYPHIILNVQRATTDAVFRVDKSGQYVTFGVPALVAWQFDSDNPDTAARCWIDGVERTVTVIAVGSGAYVSDSGGTVTLAARGNGQNPFDGDLGQAAMYRRALTTQEHTDFHADTEANQSVLPWWLTIEAIGSSSAISAVKGDLDYFNRCNDEAICDLLPVGVMWPRSRDTTIWKLCSAFAIEFGRIDVQVNVAIDEYYPDTAQQTLSDWERVCRLPDECDGVLAATVALRQQDVVDCIARDHVLNDAFWTELAAGLGYGAPTITKITGFIAGVNVADDPLWALEALFTTTMTFATGADDALLECKIQKYWPPWSTVTVVFI